MNGKYIIVNKEMLPDYFEKVIDAKHMIEKGEIKNIGEATEKLGISRSTYYKYKDHLFTINEGVLLKRVTISMILKHQKGVLSRILDLLQEYSFSVWTIIQNPPIDLLASVDINVETENALISIDEILDIIKKQDGVHKARLRNME
ncbi:MAG: ACT domain-containing protein [Eubacteriales bacterium]|nr:ACT domain-containing protein [Eubacteriales bacterium]MDY3333200.1 ACT domain-containing protein [Gallibacter sp.]